MNSEVCPDECGGTGRAIFGLSAGEKAEAYEAQEIGQTAPIRQGLKLYQAKFFSLLVANLLRQELGYCHDIRT